MVPTLAESKASRHPVYVSDEIWTQRVTSGGIVSKNWNNKAKDVTKQMCVEMVESLQRDL